MAVPAIAAGWVVGWILGALAVIIAATLLLAIIALGRRITTQADEVTEALDGVRANTEPLFDVARTNLAIDRITQGLRNVRIGGSA